MKKKKKSNKQKLILGKLRIQIVVVNKDIYSG